MRLIEAHLLEYTGRGLVEYVESLVNESATQKLASDWRKFIQAGEDEIK